MPPSVTRATVYADNTSNSSFTPLTANADRGIIALTAHRDQNNTDRNSVNSRYDNQDLQASGVDGDMGHEFGSGNVQTDIWYGDDTFLDARASSGNLQTQNIGDDHRCVFLELGDVNDGTPEAYQGASGSGTSVTTTIATTAGNVDMSHSWGDPRNYAHSVVAITGTDGDVLVVDVICVDGGDTVTPGAGQTTETNSRHTDETCYIVVSWKVVAGGGGGAPQSANATASSWSSSSVAATASVPGGGGSTGGEILRLSESSAGQIPTTAWSAVSFDTELENDPAVYAHLPNTEIEFLEAGTYKLTGTLLYEDTPVGGRANYQARAVSTSGVVLAEATSYDTGYNRDPSERFAAVKVVALFVEVAAGTKVELQHRRDTDTPNGGLIAGASSVEVVRITPDAIGIYEAATIGQAYGGTTENQVVLDSTVYESDVAAIQRSGNTVECKTQGKRYLAIGSVWGNSGAARTQRNFGLNQSGASAFSGRVIGNGYQRNAGNELAGFVGVDVGVRDGADLVWDLTCWRGDGVANDQGGADVNGNWVCQGATLIVLELPAALEVWRSHDSTGLVPVDGAFTTHNVRRDVDIADPSFSSGTGLGEIDVGYDGHVWGFWNLWGASDNVSSGARLTSWGQLLIAGAVQLLWAYYAYMRNNQGSQDTFGVALLIGGLFPVVNGNTLSVRSSTVPGGEAGSARTQPNTSVAVLINPAGWATGGGAPGQSADATASTWTVSSVAASVTVGPVLVGATSSSGVWSSASASVLAGAVSAGATPSSAAWSSTPAGVLPGPVSVASSPSSATWGTVDAAVILGAPGGLTANASPSSATFGSVAAAVVAGPVTVDAAEASAAWSSTPAAVIAGAVSTGTTPSAASWASVSATVLPGVVAVGATPSSASWVSIPASVTQGTPGGLTVAASPSSATFGSVAASVTVGPVTANATAASWSSSSSSAAVFPGPVIVDALQAAAGWSSVDALASTPALGLTANATPASWSSSSVPVAALPGEVLVDASPSSVSWTASALLVVPGPVLVDASTSSSGWSSSDAAAIPGEVIVDAIPASSVWRSVDGEPFVFVGDVTELLELPAAPPVLLELATRSPELLELEEPDRFLLQLEGSSILLELEASPSTLLQLDSEG